MAEFANALAFSADDQTAALYTSNLSASPIQNSREQDNLEMSLRDRDSGVYLSDLENSPPSSRPSSLALKHTLPAVSGSTLQHTDSARIDRKLRRPAELNLGKTSAPDASKPKSELELRFDLIRNSQTQSKAALKSPTQLLKDRLNLSPKKQVHEKIRIFTPPRPMLNGCILPGPAVRMEAFAGKDVRARTESGKAAWWCKVDKVVVFDGAEATSNEEMKFKTRSSKGLTIARRRGDCETVIIPMDCAHCQEMLNRSEWKYDIQVCKRSVCWDCKERCRWELENPVAQKQPDVLKDAGEANRARADSVLQDEQEFEEELMRKVGIETGAKSPIHVLGGIEERLEETAE